MDEKDRTLQDGITDYEIRVLGSDATDAASQNATSSDRRPASPEPPKSSKRKGCMIWGGVAAVIAAIVTCALFLFTGHDQQEEVICVNEPDMISNAPYEKEVHETISSNASVAVADTTINDIPLRIITPNGSRMELYMGRFPERDSHVMLAVQAADIRGDMDKPTGAFVYKGELIAKGHSKYGFCAIIDGEVTLGRSCETPLLERAINSNGSFFRQYALVSKGKLTEIPPKGKAIRRALCLTGGKLQIIETTDRESYHDFSQALVDIGVEEALGLVGGEALIKYLHPDGTATIEGKPYVDGCQSENYIIWRK